MKKPVKYKKWLTGDTQITSAAPREHKRAWRLLRADIARAARHCGEKWNVNSGYRSFQEQVRLYNLYKAGKGNLAAVPGTSNHGKGRAADMSVNGVPVGSTEKHRAALKRYGLCLPVQGEKWHTEHGTTWRA